MGDQRVFRIGADGRRFGTGRSPVSRAWDLWFGRLLLLSLLFTSLCVPAHAQELRAYLDRNPVRIGETVRLVIEFEGSVDARGFDAAILQTDFEVLGSSSSSRVNIVNGHQQSSSQLILELAPRREGRITIPALNLARGSTPPIELRVLEAGQAAGSEVFLEVEVDTTNPYVQAPVNLRVKLFHGIPLLEGNISDPEADGVLVRRYGEDAQYTATREGVRYRVIERHFVLFPQRSGRIAIPPVIFDGQVASTDPASMGGLFRQGRRVRARSESVELEVRSPPVPSGTDWLPARQVTLTESWPDDPPVFVVGQPVTRTLRVEAEGITGEQIPELTPAEVDGIRHYPDKPELHTVVREGKLLGVSERRVAMVPARAGAFSLPSIELQWWDTTNDRLRVARLPGRTIDIRPDPSFRPSVAHADPWPIAAASRPLVMEGGLDQHWRWIALLLGLLWLATLLLWWRDRARVGTVLPATVDADDPHAKLLSLRSTCRVGDPHHVRKALMVWAARHWVADPPRGLGALASRIDDPAIGEQLAKLDASCYAALPEHFDGSMLHDMLVAYLRRRHRQDRSTPALPLLYPDSRQT